MKAYGCFRTRNCAEARCRISICPSSVPAPGNNALVAFNVVLAGMVAKMIGLHDAPARP